jgi:hypothetical protein
LALVARPVVLLVFLSFEDIAPLVSHMATHLSSAREWTFVTFASEKYVFGLLDVVRKDSLQPVNKVCDIS